MSKLAVVVALIALSAIAEGRDVVGLVKKGDMHELVKAVPETPPDKPDKDGHTPLMAAVLRDEIEIADLLLSYKANGSVVEPASGATPLGMSFSKGKHGMARLLLAFGSNPDVKDKFGKAARQLTGKDAELKKLLEAFDNDGAAAFEDAPGTWQRHIAEDHGNIPFYYNPKTGVSRYQAPPSCSWIKASVDGHPIYVNTLTHQTQWVVPAALAWRRLIDPKTKDSYWYNYRANVALTDAPAELPPDLATEMIYETGLFWHNDVTGESTFQNPHEGNWREVLDPSGRKFWYHPETLESTWERPSELSWRQVPSHEHEGMRFWFNDKLQESTWEKPPPVAWSEQRM